MGDNSIIKVTKRIEWGQKSKPKNPPDKKSSAKKSHAQILSRENVPLYNWNDKNITHTFIIHVPIELKQKPFLGMTRMCNHETRPG